MKLFMKNEHNTGLSKTSYCDAGHAQQVWCHYNGPESKLSPQTKILYMANLTFFVTDPKAITSELSTYLTIK